MFLAGLSTGLVVAFIIYCIMSKSAKDIKDELKEIKGLLYYCYGATYDKGSGLFSKSEYKNNKIK
jgi:hypothetical protein